jgi:hypothetical protein
VKPHKKVKNVPLNRVVYSTGSETNEKAEMLSWTLAILVLHISAKMVKAVLIRVTNKS